jgi:hypothetical protein
MPTHKSAREITVDKLNKVLWCANNNWWNTHGDMEEGYMRFLAQSIHNYLIRIEHIAQKLEGKG